MRLRRTGTSAGGKMCVTRDAGATSCCLTVSCCGSDIALSAGRSWSAVLAHHLHQRVDVDGFLEDLLGALEARDLVRVGRDDDDRDLDERVVLVERGQKF